MRSTIRPAREGRRGGWGLHRAARWCPIFVRRCTIGVNAKLSWCLSLFKIQPSSDAPRNEFAGGERGDNRGTKCPDPKALLDGIQQRFFICVHGFHRWCIGRRDGRFPRLRSHRVFSALRRIPRFFRFPRSVRRRCAILHRRFGLTRLACAKGVRYTRLSPTVRSGKSVGSSPTSTMQNREYGWMSSAARWIGAAEAAGAVRSSSGARRGIAAFPSRSAACMRVPAPVRVVALASVSASVFAFAFA